MPGLIERLRARKPLWAIYPTRRLAVGVLAAAFLWLLPGTAGRVAALGGILLAGGIATAIVLLSWLLGQRKPTRAKLSPYECGMIPVGDSRERFSVKFYLVAMLFILFDVEAVFIYPWAVILRDLQHFGLWEMFVYIGIFLVGFFYIWKKGVLDWGAASMKREDF